jgi:hypothetical protein
MSAAVVKAPKEMKAVTQNLVSFPSSPVPEIDESVCARTLDEFVLPVKNDPQELIKHRFLCRGGGLLLVGQTGIGKSSLAMQLMVSWALGNPAFKIEPARPIKSLVIQAENDDGDLAEMREGVFSGLNLTEEERRLACSRIFVTKESKRTAEAFFEETVRPLLQQVKPDLIWIDPVLAYIGGESNSQEAVGAFLRNQLNPLLTEFNCGAVVVHHTNKPQAGNDQRGSTDFAYLGTGSAEWANWPRAILTLQKPKTATNVFELRAAKRGNRIGWKEADGSTSAHVKFVAHNKEPGTICWVDVEPELIEGLKQGERTTEDVVKHVPVDKPISKNRLLETCAKNGTGVNAARDLIKKLVDGGCLYEWKKKRPGSQPEKYLARIPQPVNQAGDEIFTEMFTAVLSRETHHENKTERSSHLHGSLEPVKIDREHQEPNQASFLPVTQINAVKNNQS